MLIKFKNYTLPSYICFIDGDAPSGGGGSSGGAPAGGDVGTSSTPSSSSDGGSPAPKQSVAYESPTSDDDGSDGSGAFEFPEEITGFAPAAPKTVPPKTPAPPAPPAAEAAAPGTPPVVPPQAPAPAAPQPPAAPVAAPPAPPAQTPPQESPPLPVWDSAGLAEQMQANSAFLEEQLATRLYALSPEDQQALEENASAHVPKLLARTHVQIMSNVMKQMATIVPAMLKQHSTVTKRNQEGESKFYAKWKDLKPDAHGELVARTAAMYRKMNPQATLEQMIDEVGPLVMGLAKVTPTPAAPPAAPGTPPQPRQSPFVPAPSGGAAPASATPEDEWAGLGRDFTT